VNDIVGDVTVGTEPHDRLTRLCARMTDALDEALDEELEADLAAGAMNEGLNSVRGIIFLNDDHNGGIQMFGYSDTGAGLSDLLVHMKAMFASMGKGFGVMNDQGEVLMPVGPLPEEKP
jgi:hypothetical protein